MDDVFCNCYNILDVHQTNLLFHVGAYEANPILAYFMRYPDDIQMIIYIKIFWILFLGFWVFIYNKKVKNVI